MKKWYSILFAVLLTMGVLAGCAEKEEQANESPKAGSETKAEEASYPITIEDALGDEVTIDHKPERIISLMPSNTEIAFALGLDEEVVGVSDFDNYPAEAMEKEKIGGQDINVEKVLSLHPDLVLAHESSAEYSKLGLQQVKDAGISVLVIEDALTIDQVYDTMEMIGLATGESKKAAEIIDGMKSKLETILEKANTITEKKKVLVEVSPAPEIYLAGKNTFINEMIELINAENIANDLDGWPKMDEEAMVERNPDVIVTTYGEYVENSVDQVLNQKGWENVNAVINKQVVDVNNDLVTRSGPRIVEGVEDLAKAIYPEVFN